MILRSFFVHLFYREAAKKIFLKKYLVEVILIKLKPTFFFSNFNFLNILNDLESFFPPFLVALPQTNKKCPSLNFLFLF